jgi:hypothetical protein
VGCAHAWGQRITRRAGTLRSGARGAGSRPNGAAADGEPEEFTEPKREDIGARAVRVRPQTRCRARHGAKADREPERFRESAQEATRADRCQDS